MENKLNKLLAGIIIPLMFNTAQIQPPMLKRINAIPGVQPDITYAETTAYTEWIRGTVVGCNNTTCPLLECFITADGYNYCGPWDPIPIEIACIPSTNTALLLFKKNLYDGTTRTRMAISCLEEVEQISFSPVCGALDQHCVHLPTLNNSSPTQQRLDNRNNMNNLRSKENRRLFFPCVRHQ